MPGGRDCCAHADMDGVVGARPGTVSQQNNRALRWRIRVPQPKFDGVNCPWVAQPHDKGQGGHTGIRTMG